MKLRVLTEYDRSGKYYEVSVQGETGSPIVGRGKSLKKAFGDFLINRQKDLGIEDIYLDEGAWEAEQKRRNKELAQR